MVGGRPEWSDFWFCLLVAEGPQTSVDQMGHENSQQGLPDSGWEVRPRTSVSTTCGRPCQMWKKSGMFNPGEERLGPRGPVLQCLRLRVALEWGLRGARILPNGQSSSAGRTDSAPGCSQAVGSSPSPREGQGECRAGGGGLGSAPWGCPRLRAFSGRSGEGF